MRQTGDHPTSVAVWDLDDETGEVKGYGHEDVRSYTNW